MGIPAKWVSHIEQWQSSGLDQSTYCQQKNIKQNTFKARICEYKKSQLAEVPALIPVQVKELTGVSVDSTANCSPSILFCHRNGHQLTLPLSISAVWVAALFKCLD
jgi:hypothetical protein